MEPQLKKQCVCSMQLGMYEPGQLVISSFCPVLFLQV